MHCASAFCVHLFVDSGESASRVGGIHSYTEGEAGGSTEDPQLQQHGGKEL